MEAIRVESLSKQFGDVVALADMNLEIRPGELFFLLGPSGCGKTTLLRCIAGLEQPCSGRVLFGGRDVTALPAHKREAALVFQSYALWPHLSVARNIGFGLVERRVPAPEIKRRVEEALEMVQLEGFGARGIDQMSGGQQQRVALARALVVRPKCLLLDEPLSNLDTRLRAEMRHEIRRIVKEHALTAVYVTHDQEEALAMADRIAVLNAGRVAQVDAPEAIYRSPLTSQVAAFMGATNLLAGRVTAILDRHAVVETHGTTLTGRLADPAWTPRPGTDVIVSIRPESWHLHRSEGDNQLSGKIIRRTYLGQRILYEIDTPPGLQQVVEMNPRHIHQPGDGPLPLHASRDDAVVLAI